MLQHPKLPKRLAPNTSTLNPIITLKPCLPKLRNFGNGCRVLSLRIAVPYKGTCSITCICAECVRPLSLSLSLSLSRSRSRSRSRSLPLSLSVSLSLFPSFFLFLEGNTSTERVRIPSVCPPPSLSLSLCLSLSSFSLSLSLVNAKSREGKYVHKNVLCSYSLSLSGYPISKAIITREELCGGTSA